ncbi:MAG TPA: hypothetical protein VHZ55_33915, partial [Bryobacteraceae bacterium]|nr:hypothetical protein [Bryobacteraceae bacterium]
NGDILVGRCTEYTSAGTRFEQNLSIRCYPLMNAQTCSPHCFVPAAQQNGERAAITVCICGVIEAIVNKSVLEVAAAVFAAAY